MSQPAPAYATLADLLAIPEDERFHEVLNGELIRKANPSGEHGGAQGSVLMILGPPFQRRGGGGGPGGWWFAPEVEILLASGDVVRPDIAGWRREHSPERPSGFPVKLKPNWVCEVLSPSNSNRDTVKKLRIYHQARIEHYWMIDPRDETLTVMRWAEPGYLTILRAERAESVRPEPFDAIAMKVGTLFGDDVD